MFRFNYCNVVTVPYGYQYGESIISDKVFALVCILTDSRIDCFSSFEIGAIIAKVFIL